MRAYTRTRVYSTPMKNKINISKTGTEDESESHVHVEEKLGLSFSTDPVFTWINSVCSFSDWENTRSVRVRDQVIFCYDKNDKEAEKIAVVYLFREGWAQQQEFQRSLGMGLQRFALGDNELNVKVLRELREKRDDPPR